MLPAILLHWDVCYFQFFFIEILYHTTYFIFLDVVSKNVERHAVSRHWMFEPIRGSESKYFSTNSIDIILQIFWFSIYDIYFWN